MAMGVPVRAVVLFLFLLGILTTQCDCQDTVPPAQSNAEVSILFTGRMLGYFRNPTLQSGVRSNSDFPCPSSPKETDVSFEGNQLFQAIQAYKSNSQGTDKVFVGTGDNFAVYLPSRIFAPPPANNNEQYSKDKFRWDPQSGTWVSDLGGANVEALRRDLRLGKAIVPTDNVGCFLAYAGYDAIVPGKEDFYFGAERVQALARFLASIPETDSYHPVQMLAANLLIKTSWHTGHDPIPDSKKPRLPFDISDSSQNQNILFPADGAEILPWLGRIKVKADPTAEVTISWSGDNPDVADWEPKPGSPEFKTTQCWASKIDSKCAHLTRVPDRTGKWQLSPLKPLAVGNYKACIWLTGNPRPTCSRFRVGSPLLQYADFNLQKEGAPKENLPKDTPTVPFPFVVKTVCSGFGDSECATHEVVAIFGAVDLNLEEKIGALESSWRPFSDNGKLEKKYETSLDVLDPAKSLTQLVDYLRSCFARPAEDVSARTDKNAKDQCYQAEKHEGEFKKILLAQMDATNASLLAAHLTGDSYFDVVISEYDEQQFTRNQISVVDATLSPLELPSSAELPAAELSENAKLLDCDKEKCNLPSFIAVPPPAWDPTWSGDRSLKNPSGDPVRVLHISELDQNQRQYVVSGTRKAPTAASIQVPLAERQALVETRRPLASEFKLKFPALFELCMTIADGFPKEIPPCSLKDIGEQNTEVLAEAATKALQEITLYSMLRETHADIALVQKHDFYLQIPMVECLLNQLAGIPSPAPCAPAINEPSLLGARAWQKILDAIIWKGDLLTVIPVRGSTLLAVMKRSRQFDANDDSSLSLTKEKDRGLLPLGIKPEGYKDTYLINDLPLDPNRVYTVATTDYIALGDTGYPDLVDASVPELPRPLYEKKVQQVSTLVCRQLNEELQRHGKSTNECAPDIDSKQSHYFDELAVQGPKPPLGNTWQEGWKDWFLFKGCRGQDCPKSGPKADLGTWAQEQPTWKFSLDKTTIGFTVQRHSDSQAALNSTFGGVSNAQATAPRSHSWSTDQEMSYTYIHPKWDFVSTEALLYNASFTDAKSGAFRTPNQSADSITLTVGPRLHFPEQRKLPHWGLGTYFHYDTQPWPLQLSLNLTTNNGLPVAVPLQPYLPRVHTVTDRISFGRYDQKSYFEAGLEGGRAIGAFDQFDFYTNGSLVLICVPSAALSLQKCLGKSGDTIVTPASKMMTVQSSRYRTGAYWHSLLNFPTGKKMVLSLENQGEFYFNNSGDNSTDTRIQHLTTAKYSFQVFPSLSFAPTYEIFAFENKQAYKSLWQQQAMIAIDFKFDWTSPRIARSQLEYRAAPVQ
jgi:hypothetical protein